MRHLAFLLIALLAAATAGAGVSDELRQDVNRSANNYLAYPDRDLPALTAAPAGYEPFFINHYARHGSRWLITPQDYDYVVDVLGQAQRKGCLSAAGVRALEVARRVQQASKGRLGELTALGAEQHRGIARRMVQNFPAAFGDGATVDAKSTVVVRCILSMLNEVNQIRAMRPHVSITTDASEHDMRFMNFHDSAGFAAKDLGNPAVAALKSRCIKPQALLKRLFTSSDFRQGVDGEEFMLKLFQLAANMQSHKEFAGDDLYSVFTREEIESIWTYNNAWWYVHGGETPLTNRRVPYVQANLLRDFIQAADRAVTARRHGAALRFGHETMVLSLAVLMGLNGADYQTTDLTTLADKWQAFKIFPMACNIQMVLYRNTSNPDDILVKVLLNEREAHLPVATTQFPYYRWRDVRDFLTRRLDQHQP